MKPDHITRGDAIDQVQELSDLARGTVSILRHKQHLRRNRVHHLYRKKNEITTAYQKSIAAIDREIKSTESRYPAEGAGKVLPRGGDPADL